MIFKLNQHRAHTAFEQTELYDVHERKIYCKTVALDSISFGVSNELPTAPVSFIHIFPNGL